MIAEALRERRSEIEQAIMTRVYAVSEPPPGAGPEYTDGLRAAVSAGVEYGLEGIERGEQSAPPLPDILLSQARLAARSGVSLDTVLRRYFAGHTLLEDFLVEEAEQELDPTALKRLLRSQAAIVDRLLAAVSSAYTKEAKRRPQSPERRKAERVERLLAGEPMDASELNYELDGWHLGLAVSGLRAHREIAELASMLDRRSLIVRREDGTAWGWLGSKRTDPAKAVRTASGRLSQGLSVAFGEPGEGLVGWRLTHRQARAALSVTGQGTTEVVRYVDVALVVSARQDDLLLASLRHLYLDPLSESVEDGARMRETLRAYFSSGRNVTSAAASLGVYRRTVTKRLHLIEERIGRRLEECSMELQLALQIEETA